MSTNQVLFAGGSGVVGRAAVHWFSHRYPQVGVLVGGRKLETVEASISDIPNAKAVVIDMEKPAMGLGDDIAVSAVLMLAPDDGLHGLRFAQDRGVPYLNIGNGLIEVGPEMAHFAHRPTASAVVLASHWAAGAALFLALAEAKKFDHVSSIATGVLLDENDPAGPLAYADMERLHDAAPASLAFVDGRRTLLTGDALNGSLTAIDGRTLAAAGFDPFDIISLHAETRAANIRFDLLTGESSSRRRGAAPAAEIVVELRGQANGRDVTTRTALEFPHGQASLTALSAVLTLATALGLTDKPAARPGLYLPELLCDSDWFLEQLRQEGAVIYHDLK